MLSTEDFKHFADQIAAINTTKEKLINISYNGHVDIDDGHRIVGGQFVNNSTDYKYDPNGRLIEMTNVSHHQDGWDVKKCTNVCAFTYDQDGSLVNDFPSFYYFDVLDVNPNLKIYSFMHQAIVRFRNLENGSNPEYIIEKTSETHFRVLSFLTKKYTTIPTGEITEEKEDLATFRFRIHPFS